MQRLTAIAVAFVLLGGCHRYLSTEVWDEYGAGAVYTCCNLHYEGPDISDANYYAGTMLPLGTPVTAKSSGGGWITFDAAGGELTLEHAYGTNEEPFQQYVAKVLVFEDPKIRLATFSPAVQEAIRQGRVEEGMTREQVIMSLGYPPTHRTPSLDAPEWIYWLTHFGTYRVQFDRATALSEME